jgi:hypothetical protein
MRDSFLENVNTNFVAKPNKAACRLPPVTGHRMRRADVRQAPHVESKSTLRARKSSVFYYKSSFCLVLQNSKTL